MGGRGGQERLYRVQVPRRPARRDAGAAQHSSRALQARYLWSFLVVRRDAHGARGDNYTRGAGHILRGAPRSSVRGGGQVSALATLNV